MSPTLITIDAGEPLQAILDIIARDGGVIVSNFLPPDLLKETMTSSEYGLAVFEPIP
jgi:RNA:NAD 2'-phosphotransferase (TPT1/KptA family)